jgi:hypothetical protein
MFKYKNAMISMAVVAMLAACGGGGGGGKSTGGSSDGGGGNGGPVGGGSGGVVSLEDQKFAGNMTLGQVLLGPDGTQALSYEQYTSNTPRAADHPENPNGYGSYYPRSGTNAPLATVGYRLNYAAPDTPAAESVGRVAFELKDQATGAGQEVLQILVDKLNVSAAATDVNFAVSQDAKMYLYAKNSAGDTTTVEITAPSTVVREVPIAGDPSSFGLLFDVEAAVSAAIQGTSDPAKLAVLNSIKSFSAEPAAPFATSLSFSNLNIVRGAESAPVVVGDIKVTGFDTVPGILNGGGIGDATPGYIQITPLP